MPMDISVQRKVMIPSPGKHISVWAINPSYSSPGGLGMVMTVVRINSDGTGSDNWRQWTQTTQRWTSPDNAATWRPDGPENGGGTYESGNSVGARHFFLDPDNGVLLAIFNTVKRDPCGAVTSALHYEVSRDACKAWESARQIICSDGTCDAENWMPGFGPGKMAAQADQAPICKLGDGAIVFGASVKEPDRPLGVVFLRGTWSDGAGELLWDAGDVIRTPEAVSVSGCCEPDLLPLGGQRLLTTMRCQGVKTKGVPSTRQMAVSEDGGRTWSPPRALTYDDGSAVCVPASIAKFAVDPTTGRAYWFANILAGPVTGQLPRYPLTIAELDTERLCIIRDSVTVVQDLPEGAVRADEDKRELGRRYSNFGHYVDRVTNEFVLMMAEEPKTDWDDYTSDCIRFRISTR